MTLYILDTDHLSLHQRGDKFLNEQLKTMLKPNNAAAITIITAEEFIRGRLAQVSRARKPAERVTAYHWLSETLDYLFAFDVLKYTQHAENYFKEFRTQKIRVGSQDLKIASIALSRNAVLVTRNKRDFKQIPNLKFEDWSKRN